MKQSTSLTTDQATHLIPLAHPDVYLEIASNPEEHEDQMPADEEDHDLQQGGRQPEPTNFNHPQYSTDDGDEIPGQYNPNDYKGLGVSSEIQELFAHIGR